MKINMAEEKTIEQQCEEYLTGWKRALADYDNLKKDLAKEKQSIRESVRESVALQLLPVVDNFETAARHMPDVQLSDDDAKKLKNWSNGIGFVQTQLVTILHDLGLEEIKANGAFNPDEHDAVGERHEEGKAEGEIVEVVYTGWKLDGKVIRPAKVIISK